MKGAFEHVPLGEGGGPKGGGWIRIEEAGSAKQVKRLRESILSLWCTSFGLHADGISHNERLAFYEGCF